MIGVTQGVVPVSGVNLIHTETEQEADGDAEEMLVGMLQHAHISTVGFRQGSKM